MSRILCLWLPNWPIQRRQVVIRKSQSVVSALVLEASDPRGGYVAACCARAASAGIFPGMPVAEAKSLLPRLIVEPHDPPADRRALEQLAEACEVISPCVGLEDAEEPECLLLDVANLEHLWGNDSKLVARVERYFNRRAYRVRVAAAGTIGLAWALAHFSSSKRGVRGENRQDDSASRDPQSSIHLLPIEALRIAEETAALLHELGINTVGQLALLPRESLSSRFGDALLRRLDQLAGLASEVIVPHRAMAPLVVEQKLEEPTADRAVLTHVLQRLVDQLAIQLAARDQGAILMVCLLRCSSNARASLRIGLLQPSSSPRQLMELVDLHLESLTLVDAVTAIEMRVVASGRLGQRQGELFTDQWPGDPHQLALLVNRLSSRLGYEQVLRPELRASPVPERAARFVAAVGSRDSTRRRAPRGGSAARDSRPSTLIPVVRPLMLYPEPQPLDVVCVAPDGPPQFVWRQAWRERVAEQWGPERIETLWWRGRSVRRDYYRIATESGEQLWIFRRLRDGRWFLHGLFG